MAQLAAHRFRKPGVEGSTPFGSSKIMDTRHKGEIAKLKVMLRAADKGFFVSVPTTEGCRYDLVIDDYVRLWRAQCKYVTYKPSGSAGCVAVGLTKCSGYHKKGKYRPYTRQDIDVLVVYLPETDEIVWLPPEVWEGKSAVQLRTAPTLNRQVKKTILTSQYLW